MAIYIESNKTGAKSFFEKREKYNKRLADPSYYYDKTYKNLVDFKYGEKALYGRVNRLFVPVEPKTDNIKRFNSRVAETNGVGALNFVVDAFHDLALQFQKCAFIGKIDTNDTFLNTLKVFKAYESPQRSYTNHREIYFDTLAEIFREREIKVRNFDQFIDHLLPLLEKSAHRNPITKPAFIKSRRCSPGTSGLVIEIADMDPVNDQGKINQFVDSNNWDFYVNTCNAYGFMVDRFVPWRIVADIGSEPIKSAMFEYAEKYDLHSTDDVIDNFYEPVHVKYYNIFKSDLLVLYNRVKLRRFLELQQCDGGTITRAVYPATYTPTTYYARFSEQYFLRTYLKIRFFEEESHFSENEKKLIIDDCVEIYLQHSDVQPVLDVFEKMLNKTLDYRGSLSYIIRHLDATEGEMIDAAFDPVAVFQGY